MKRLKLSYTDIDVFKAENDDLREENDALRVERTQLRGDLAALRRTSEHRVAELEQEIRNLKAPQALQTKRA